MSATLSRSAGLRGVVDEQVGAGVAVEVGEPQRARRAAATRDAYAARAEVSSQSSRSGATAGRRVETPARRRGTVGWYGDAAPRLGPRVVAGAAVVLVSVDAASAWVH